jgi:hypothetical protein
MACAGHSTHLVGDWLWQALTRDADGLKSLVVGHYQPLADNPGIAPKSDQTWFPAVGSENT